MRANALPEVKQCVRLDKTTFLNHNYVVKLVAIEIDMYRFPCPYCLAKVSAPTGRVGQKCRCPECKNRIYLIHEDNLSVREVFPAFQWQMVNDERTSIEHQRIVELGAKSEGYYWLDDSAFKGWWDARRKGITPCRCRTRLIDQEELKTLNLDIVYITHFSFDPWSPLNRCVTSEPS